MSLHFAPFIASTTGCPGSLSEASDDAEPRPRICVIGVGGAGCNAVNHMIARAIDRVRFISINTDAVALGASTADECILLSRKGARERASVADPPYGGAELARHSLPRIRQALSGAQVCFIAAGMGGRIGTSAVVVVARAARSMGILTVAVVTMPFTFEGGRRRRLARRGIEELRRNSDTMIVIPNQNLLLTSGGDTTVRAAFQTADEVLEHGVRNIADLILEPGIVNVDFADIRAVMQGMGQAVLGIGEGSGARRALDAAETAVGNRLLDGALDGSRKLLISIVGGDDMRLADIDEAANSITRRVHPDAHIVWGSAHDARLKGKIRVLIVATDVAAKPKAAVRSMLSFFPCHLGGHSAAPATISNQGCHFGTCQDCGIDLIRCAGKWRKIPQRFKVVWRRADSASSYIIGGVREVKPIRRGSAGLRLLEARGIALYLFYSLKRQWIDENKQRSYQRNGTG